MDGKTRQGGLSMNHDGMESLGGYQYEAFGDSLSPSQSGGKSAASLPSPTVGWRREQSLSPLKLTTNLGALDASRSLWRVPAANEVPPGMDRESYLAGEKDALLRIFQDVLPSQQALGALAAAVQQLQHVAEEFREVQGTVHSLQAAMQGHKDRVATLETQRLPALDLRLDALQTQSAPQELIAVLKAVHGLHNSAVAAQKADADWRQKSNVERLVITFKSWITGSVSQVDVALLFLSRRLLLGRYGDSLTQEQGGLGHGKAGRRAVLAASLYVLAIEMAWQAQKAGAKNLPWPLKDILKPLSPGLKLMRAACWGAIMVLGAHEIRNRCLLLTVTPSDPQVTANDSGAGRSASEHRQSGSDPSEHTGVAGQHLHV